MFSINTKSLMQIIKSTSKSVQKDLIIILAKPFFYIELQKLPYISIMYTFLRNYFTPHYTLADCRLTKKQWQNWYHNKQLCNFIKLEGWQY